MLLAPLTYVAAARRPALGALAAALSAPSPSHRVASVLLECAALFTLALLAALAADVIRVVRVKRAARPLGALAVRRAALRASAAVSSPTAIGYLHPAVVVPADFRDKVDAREWNAVLAHECAHLARRDDWSKALQSAALRAGWWLPGLWLLAPALDIERELASDESAAAAMGCRRYAACLLRLATDRCGTVAPAFFGRRSHVAVRVERLLRPAAATPPAIRAAALGGFALVLLVAAGGAIALVPGGAPAPAPALRAARAPVSAIRRAPRRIALAVPHRRPPHHSAVRPPAPPLPAAHPILAAAPLAVARTVPLAPWAARSGAEQRSRPIVARTPRTPRLRPSRPTHPKRVAALPHARPVPIRAHAAPVHDVAARLSPAAASSFAAAGDPFDAPGPLTTRGRPFPWIR